MWLVDTDVDSPWLEDAEATTARLAADLIQRGEGIVDHHQRARWRASHIALRLVLERWAGPGIRERPFEIVAGGRPSFAEGPVFSLSHSGSIALVAVTWRGALGIDVEGVRTMRLAPDRLRRLLDAGAGLTGTDPPTGEPSDGDGIAAWVRLEAFAKARGTGVWPALGDLDVSGRHAAAPDLGHSARQAAARLAREAHIVVRDLDLGARGAHYRAALAFQAPDTAALETPDLQTPVVRPARDLPR